jgi:hypothetical protein
MNNRFIESCHFPLLYERKPETKSSFYQKAGIRGILPARISWGINSICKDSNKLKGKINEINAQYKKAEEGLYKMLNRGKIHTSIWGLPEFPEFYGYGILDERFNVYDLLILYSGNNCSSSIEIHLFRGMGKPEFLEDAFNYCRNIINKKPPQGL